MGIANTTWHEVKLEEVAEKIGMGPFGSNIKVDTFVKDGVPIISGNHLRGTQLEDNHYNFISVEHADRLISSNVKRGDVVFTHAGNIGQVAYIPNNSKYERYVLSQRQFYLRPNRSHLLAEYLAYYFKSPIGQHQLMTYASQVGVPSISQPVSNLKSTSILLPPIEEQHLIVELLLSFDNKIELLQKENGTLEQAAQTIFDDWFASKVDGKAPQREWRVVPLDELIETNPSVSISRKEPSPYIDMAALPTHGSWPERPVQRLFSSGSRFQNGDTLLARITPCLENGKTAFIQNLPEGEAGWGSTEFIVLRSKPPVPAEYAYLLARNKAFRDYAIQMMSGTSGRQRVQTDMLGGYPVVSPDKDTLQVFSAVVGGCFAKIKANSIQIETLSEIRDFLLPKLMNGEVLVND